MDIIKVLSIEDNPGDARLIEEHLRSASALGWGLPYFELEWVDNLAAGLARLDVRDFDAVLTDLDLPDSRAGDTFATLRAYYPHLPIVVLTGREDEELALRAVRTGAQDYLFKREVTGTLLAHAITYAIERQQAKDALQQAHDELEERVAERTAELARANEELQQERENLLKMFAAAPVGMLLLDEETVIVQANEAAATLVLREPAEVIGKRGGGGLGCIHSYEDSRGCGFSNSCPDCPLRCGVESVLSGVNDSVHGAEISPTLLIAGEPEERCLLVSAEPVFIRGHKHVIVAVEDITERKRAENELKESMALLQATLEATADGIVTTDKDSKVLNYNQRFADMWNSSDEWTDIPALNDRLARMWSRLKEPERVKARIEELYDNPEIESYDAVELTDGRIFERYTAPYYIGDEIAGRIWSFRDVTESKYAEEALRQSEEKFRSIIHLSPIGVGVVDSKGDMTDCNAALAEMIGYSREELLRLNFANFTHEDDLKREWELINELWAGDRVDYRMEKRYIHRDGHTVWVDVAASLFKGESGELEFGFAFVEDITERKRTEERLRESESRLQAILDYTSAIIYLKDAQGRFVLVNRAFENAFNITQAEMVGKSSYDFVSPELAVEHQANDTRVIQTREPLQFEEEAIEADGQKHTVISIKFPIYDAAGEVYGVGGISTDITARKRAEEVLRESEARLQRIFSAAPVGIGMVAGRELQFANAAICEMLGYAPEELVGQNARILYPDDEEFARVGRVKLPELSEKGSAAIETRFKCKDGSVRDILMSSSLIDPQNPAAGIVSTAVDITERKRMENELRSSLQNEKFLGDIIRNASVAIGVGYLDGRQGMFNVAAQELTGYNEEELKTVDWNSTLTPVEWQEYEADKLTELHRTKSAVRYEKEYLHKDGSRIPVEVVVHPGFDANGNIAHYVAFVTDITERKRAKETLQRERERMDVILSALEIGLSLIKSDMTIAWVNQKIRDMFPDKEPIGEVCHVFYENSDTPCTGCGTRQTFADGAVHVIDRFNSNNQRWYSVISQPIKDARGQVESVLEGIVDITARKRVEEELYQALTDARRHQAEVAALLEGARAVLQYREFAEAARVIFDVCKELIGAASGYVALLSEDGAENELLFLDAGGLPCTVDPELPMPIRGLRAEAYHSGAAVYDNEFTASEWMKFMPEGHVKLDNVLFAPLVIESKTIGLLGLANKVAGFTEHDAHMATAFGELAAIALRNSRTLAALLASEEKYRGIVEQSQDGITLTDERGIVIEWNRAMERVTGLSAADVLGQPIWDVQLHLSSEKEFMPEYREYLRTMIEKVLETGQAPWLGQFQEREYNHPNETRRFVQGTVFPIKTSKGFMLGSVSRDITAQKLLEEERARYAAELRRSNEDLQQFTYTVSHDLKEPLRMVKNYVELLQRRYQGQLDEDADEFIYFAVDGAARMERLIEGLLKYARIDRKDKEFAAVDMEEVFAYVLQDLRLQIEESGAVVTHDALPRVWGDELQLGQLVQNLISNALKFRGAESPRVHISATPSPQPSPQRGEGDTPLSLSGSTPASRLRAGAGGEGVWLFSVRDNGIGIAPKNFDRLFGIFQRLHTRQEYEGSGIGLATCRKIVERHEGRIWVEAEEGKGATFYFTLLGVKT